MSFNWKKKSWFILCDFSFFFLLDLCYISLAIPVQTRISAMTVNRESDLAVSKRTSEIQMSFFDAVWEADKNTQGNMEGKRNASRVQRRAWTPASGYSSPPSPISSQLSWDEGRDEDFQSQMDENGIIGLREMQEEVRMLAGYIL